MSRESITSREAATRLMAWCEAHKWRIYLDKGGRMAAIIGSDTPTMPQAVILAALGAMEPDVVALLRGLKRVH